jgi:hypothetical protein
MKDELMLTNLASQDRRADLDLRGRPFAEKSAHLNVSHLAAITKILQRV